MTDNEKKTAHFIQTMQEEASAQCEKIKRDTDAFVAEELEKTRVEAKKRAKAAAKVEMSKRSEQSNTDSYKTRIQLVQQIVEKRQEITRRVFTKAAKEIVDFTRSNAYLPFLEKSIRNIQAEIGEDAVIFLRPEDERLAADLSGLCKEIRTDTTILLGGCKGVNDVTHMRADDTLDARLDAQRELFYAQSGLSIS